MNSFVICLSLLVAETARPAPSTMIKIVVSDQKDAPIASRIFINRGDRWAPFADTGPNGQLVREFSCADGIMFKAIAPNSRYYDSEERFCDSEVKLRLIAKPNPSLANNAYHDVIVGGAPMYATKNIMENAIRSQDHTTLVAAVKAAGLVDTLQGPGPFTVFAPTNAAFAKLPAGTVGGLLKPENQTELGVVLNYHVVPGALSSVELINRIRSGDGRAVLTTIQGKKLIVTANGSQIILTDAKGGQALVKIANIRQSNGIIHTIDAVLLP